jgi:hypothetical protein
LLLQIVVFELPPVGEIFGGEKPPADKPQPLSKATATLDSASVTSTSDSSLSRKKREPLQYHSPPLIRVIGYDPRTKKNSIIEVATEAVVEVAGGAYSQYLEPDRRKELAKILIDALAVHFPRGGGFDLLLPWSGSKVKASNVQASTKTSWRSSAEKILKRTGKIFRSAMRISSHDIIVSVYAMGITADGTLSSSNRSVIMNFYSAKCSEATEIQLPPEVQMEYVGKVFVDLPAGEARADAIREFCQFLRADIAEDPGDSSLRVLEVELQSKEKERGAGDGSQGITEPIGKILYRQKTSLYLSETREMSTTDYLLTLSNRSLNESDGPERGVMGRIFEPETGLTLAVTYDPEEVLELCTRSDQPDLLRDLVTARRYLSDLTEQKEGEQQGEDDFLSEIEKVEWSSKIKTYVSMVCDYIARDIGLHTKGSGSSPPSPERGGGVRLFSRMREGDGSG